MLSSCQFPLATAQEINQLIASEARFPQQRHQSAFRQIAIVLRNDRPTARCRMVIDVVAASRMVEDEVVLFKKADDLARLDRGELAHHLLLYQARNP